LNSLGGWPKFFQSGGYLRHRCRAFIRAMGVAEKKCYGLSLEIRKVSNNTRVISKRESLAELNAGNIGGSKRRG
jgi:hypothetical protein